jgi:serine/threonine-protein kinase
VISDAELAKPANFPNLGERFEVLSFIGQGGMGAVYKVKDKSINQILAIKLLNDKFAQDPTGVKRFESEAKASCQLTHANLVTIYDYCRTTSGVPFIVMDFLDGKTLADFIKQNVYLTVPEALDIFCQIADALTGVHSKGIIHRDLKPANILLLPGEGGYMVKLVDFGIAKVLPEMTNYATTVTETSELTGSPLYMSPEQCQGERVDARSDIYSLGCVMYEALTGVNPFMSDNQIKVILAQISSITRPFRQSVDITNCLQSLVFKCLKKSPAERYQTAARLLKDLDAMRDGKDVAVFPEPTSAALAKVGDA